MLTEYRNLPWPCNLWSTVFQREVSREELPKDWEETLEHVFKTVENKKRVEILLCYFQERRTLNEIGTKFKIGREAVRQNIGTAIQKMRRPTNKIFLTYGYTVGEKLLAEKKADARIADNESIDILNLSTRANNCLKRKGIETLGQLRRCSEQDLLKTRNMGEKTLEEIRRIVSGFPKQQMNNRLEKISRRAEEDARVRFIELLHEAESLPACSYSERYNVVANHLMSAGATFKMHGNWGPLPLDSPNDLKKQGQITKKCSICDWTSTCRYNYCPNCGAKMDLND